MGKSGSEGGKGRLRLSSLSRSLACARTHCALRRAAPARPFRALLSALPLPALAVTPRSSLVHPIIPSGRASTVCLSSLGMTQSDWIRPILLTGRKRKLPERRRLLGITRFIGNTPRVALAWQPETPARTVTRCVHSSQALETVLVLEDRCQLPIIMPYPESAPFDEGHLKVSEIHSLQ